MRKEKLEELHECINELKTVRKTLVESEYIFEDGKVVKRKGFMDVEKYMVELSNGMVVPREKILKDGKNKSAAIVMPITKEGQVVLVVQSRSSTHESVCVEFPSGYVEEGEEPEYGGVRELIEETGYVPKQMVLLDKFYQDQSCGVCAYNYNYLALGCEKKEKQHLDENEAIRFIECSIDEVFELLEMGYFTDIQTKYTLTLAKQYIKK